MKDFKHSIIWIVALLGTIQTPVIAQDTTQIESTPVVLHQMESFKELEVNGAIDVYLQQGDEETVALQLDENILPKVELYQRGDRIVVDLKKNNHVIGHKHYKILVTFKDLEKLEMNGIGKLRCRDTLQLSHLDVRQAGIGNLELILNAKELNGTFDAVGKVRLIGRVRNADLEMNGIGKLYAYDLIAEHLTIERNGIGKAEVHATQSLVVENSGIGSVRYRGNPEHIRKDPAAIGRIKAKR